MRYASDNNNKYTRNDHKNVLNTSEKISLLL